MKNKMKSLEIFYKSFLLVFILNSCALPSIVQKEERTTVPDAYFEKSDTANSGKINYRDFFDDNNLLRLIDTALRKNQELNIILQEIRMSQIEVEAKKGEYLPEVQVNAGVGTEKVGRYTSQGANDANTDIMNGKEFPDPLSDFLISADVSWEVDVWKILRNAKESAVLKYLSTIEGKNFAVTKLIAEVAAAYYELVALDNQLTTLNQNIEIQQNALSIVKLQKKAGEVTELAVKRFEAELLKNKSYQYEITQDIIEVENRIRFLVGGFQGDIQRNSDAFVISKLKSVDEGVPSQLLENRPDLRAAELSLRASKLDLKAAKANFYPSLRITAGIGYNAFNPSYLLSTPESILYGIAGDIATPLINRKAIKASYISANAKQIQAVYNYEQTILNAFIEVSSLVASIENLQNSFELKEAQVEALNKSISISIGLFKSARADYMEVLMTQRDALEARIELIETKKSQMIANVELYQALGGGWR
jgi:outer membrane protein, multidrug efflux system